MKMQQIKSARLIFLLGALALPACETTRHVAVTSFHVIDAPANYLRHQIDESERTTTTVTTVDSDGQRSGRPVVIAESTTRPVSQTATVEIARTKPRVAPERTVARRQPTPKPAPAQEPSELPYGKPVSGKPGYVYSPYDPSGGYVDVTGFSSGSKVKDPYSNRIFLVP